MFMVDMLILEEVKLLDMLEGVVVSVALNIGTLLLSSFDVVGLINDIVVDFVVSGYNIEIAQLDAVDWEEDDGETSEDIVDISELSVVIKGVVNSLFGLVSCLSEIQKYVPYKKLDMSFY